MQLQRIKRQVSEQGAAAVCRKETEAAIRTANQLAEEAVEQADADIKAVENLLLLRQAHQRNREEVEKRRRKLQDLQSLQSALDARCAVEMEDATSTADEDSQTESCFAEEGSFEVDVAESRKRKRKGSDLRRMQTNLDVISGTCMDNIDVGLLLDGGDCDLTDCEEWGEGQEWVCQADQVLHLHEKFSREQHRRRQQIQREQELEMQVLAYEINTGAEGVPVLVM